MRGRGRGGAIPISLSQFVVSLNIPLQAFEGAGGTSAQVDVTASRSGNWGYVGSCDWVVSPAGDNPATLADFGGAWPSGTLNFGAEEASRPIQLTIYGNNSADGDRTFLVTISNPSTTGGSGAAAIGVGQVICTIIDDDTEAGTTFVKLGDLDVYYDGNPTTYGPQ